MLQSCRAMSGESDRSPSLRWSVWFISLLTNHRHHLLHDCLLLPSTLEGNKTIRRLLWITESVFEEKGESTGSLDTPDHRWVRNLLTIHGVPGEQDSL
jgi:hypothetical protein